MRHGEDVMVELSRLKKRMSVIAADGQRIGFVARIASPDRIRITCLSGSHGYDHIIPLTWVSEIDKYVHLNRTSRFVTGNWEHAPAVRRVDPAKAPRAPVADPPSESTHSRPKAA
jgi:hypothetical protein